MAKKEKTKTFGTKDEIYFQCNKCGDVVFKTIGCLTHLRRKHNIRILTNEIGKHFTVENDPPAGVVEAVEKKKKYQKLYKEERKKAKSEGPNYKCNECGHVVNKKTSLYTHCKTVHKKSLSYIGYTETSEPPTNTARSDARMKQLNRKEGKQTKQNQPPAIITEHMPTVIDIPKAEAVKDGLIITVRFKISTSYVATFVLPTLS